MNAPLQIFGVFSSVGSVVAGVVIGVAFGWFLERGGLGDARKLSGQFYFTDLTVFKVLFTALVTAMLGVFWLARLGILEPRLLDTPPTFLAPVLLGGAIFGVGFLLGGLCPGTSCVSAASGRIDGMLVVLGMFVGVLAFMELHPVLEEFHNTTDRGILTLPAALGVRPGLVVGGVAALALLAFLGAERIAHSPHPSRARRPFVWIAIVLAVGATIPFGGVAWPGLDDPARQVASIDLAQAIRDGSREVRILDIRSAESFADFHLPLAESAPMEDLPRMEFDAERPTLVYGFGTVDGERARVLLEQRGVRDVTVLEGGAVDWLRSVMMPYLPDDPTPEERERFSRVADLSRYFGGTPVYTSGRGAATDLDLTQLLGQARRASCGW